MTEGKREFLEMGFKDASLRNIVKQAGVSTGTFYGYFTDKAALFHTLVSPTAYHLKEVYLSALKSFDTLPPGA